MDTDKQKKKTYEPPFVSGKVSSNEPTALLLSRDVRDFENSPFSYENEKEAVAHPKISW